MAESQKITLRIDTQTGEALDRLAASQHITKSALVRKLLDIGMEKELASESIDFIRDQINTEIKSSCYPQFNRVAGLTAKIGYQSVSCFYLLCYIMDVILPPSKRQDFEDIKRKSKAMAITYLKFREDEYLKISKAEDASLADLEHS